VQVAQQQGAEDAFPNPLVGPADAWLAGGHILPPPVLPCGIPSQPHRSPPKLYLRPSEAS
jgi:hypothetical protein